MPSYLYSDTERVYPETRDAHGIHVGLVQAGDVRDFDQAPDSRWVLADGQEAPGTSQEMTAVEHPADGTWSPEISAPEMPQDGPVPAPPAVVPGT